MGRRRDHLTSFVASAVRRAAVQWKSSAASKTHSPARPSSSHQPRHDAQRALSNKKHLRRPEISHGETTMKR